MRGVDQNSHFWYLVHTLAYSLISQAFSFSNLVESTGYYLAVPLLLLDTEILRQSAASNQARFTTKKLLVPPTGIDLGSFSMQAFRSTAKLQLIYINLRHRSHNLAGLHRLPTVAAFIPRFCWVWLNPCELPNNWMKGKNGSRQFLGDSLLFWESIHHVFSCIWKTFCDDFSLFHKIDF